MDEKETYEVNLTGRQLGHIRYMALKGLHEYPAIPHLIQEEYKEIVRMIDSYGRD